MLLDGNKAIGVRWLAYGYLRCGLAGKGGSRRVEGRAGATEKLIKEPRRLGSKLGAGKVGGGGRKSQHLSFFLLFSTLFAWASLLVLHAFFVVFVWM